MEKHAQPPFHIRKFGISDVTRVAELEKLCNPLPWSAASLHIHAESSDLGDGLRRVGLVAVLEGAGEVAGYVCANLIGGEAEILVLGVASEHRRLGIGKALLEGLAHVLRAADCRSLFLEVRRGNQPAVSMYLGAGFREAGIRKGYYADTGEDALLMRLDFSG